MAQANILCWTDREPTDEWQPSDGNFYWRPKGHRYPNTRELKPGDIILFRPVKPKMSQRLIRRFQKGVPFTHAALYLSNDSIICEAIPGRGVAFSDLEDKLRKSCLLVRRVPGIDNSDRERMAKAAADLRGAPYAFEDVFRKASEPLLKRSPAASRAERKGVICSTLCEHAILMGSKGTVQIRKFRDQVVSPADLVISEALVDVSIEWRRVTHQPVASNPGIALGL
jgi:hypothetical protein